MVTIRQATPRDEDAIGSILLEAWRIGYRGLVPDDAIAAARPGRMKNARECRLTKGGAIGRRQCTPPRRRSSPEPKQTV
jgi:hypothetical protein